MSEEIKFYFGEDGIAREYDDTYDITIHCTSQEEQDNVLEKLNREECPDAISRQVVLDLPRIKTHNQWGNVIKESVDVEGVRQLPPVNPAEKVGRWKRISMDKYSEHAKYWYRCDRCGEDNLGNTNYCPHCGAKMQEVEE